MKNRRTISILVSFVVISVLLVACLPKAAPVSTSGQPIVLTAVSAWPLNNVGTEAFRTFFVTPVNERGKGKVEIKYLGGPEVISPRDLLAAVRKGTVDIVNVTGAYFGGEIPSQNAKDYIDPAKGRGFIEDQKVWDLVAKIFREGADIELLAYTHSGAIFRYFTSKDPATKGLRVRPSSPLGKEQVTALGWVSDFIPSAELVTALERGVIDGAMRGPDQVITEGEIGLYKYVIGLGVYHGIVEAYMQGKKWRELPPDVQKLLLDVGRDCSRKTYDFVHDRNEGSLQVLVEKYKYKLVPPTPEMVTKSREARLKILDDIMKQCPSYASEMKEVFQPYY